MTKFKAGFLLKNRHIQTLYSSLFRDDLHLETTKEIFEFDDGDFTEIYWHKKPKQSSKTPIVILFHGLTGSIKSSYIQGAMQELGSAGFATVLMQFRSCGDALNNLPRSYHSGETGDAKAFIFNISSTYIDSKLFAIGYSLGGNMLLKLLGEERYSSKLSGAIAVSAPMKLDRCGDAINSGFSKIYQHNLIKDLNTTLKLKYKKHDMSMLKLKESEIDNIKTFWDFDGLYTAPIHGFESAQDYYTKCSAKGYLKSIEIPTLIIHSKDDPFMTTEVIPTEDEISSRVELEIYESGGHVGFISGSIFSPIYWLDKRVCSYFKTL